jgi:hypothetical protein
MVALCACGFLLSLTACNTRLSENDQRERCRNVESCVGDSNFNYSSIEACVEDQMSVYNDLEGECRKKYARAINCFNRNFQCENGQPDFSACEEQQDAFENADCG